jgi:hypothetical protein
MNNDIVVDSKTIEVFSKGVQSKSEELNTILDEMIVLSNDLDRFFNTPTGKVMKDSLMEYLINSKKTCESLKNYGVVLEKSTKLYDVTNSQIAHEVGLGD